MNLSLHFISSKSILALLFLLSASVLQADRILLEDVMSPAEQKKTGISTLSFQQKIELENWLNNTFVLKATQAPLSSNLSLSMNIKGGQQLRLSDGSLWAIAPSSVGQAAVWIFPIPIQIQNSNDPDYPYYLVNSQTQEKVKAKKIPNSSS